MWNSFHNREVWKCTAYAHFTRQDRIYTIWNDLALHSLQQAINLIIHGPES